MAFGYFRPRSVGAVIQGRYAHVLVDRVRGVLAHVAVDPVPASVPRHLAYAPKGVLLASPAPHADPVVRLGLLLRGGPRTARRELELFERLRVHLYRVAWAFGWHVATVLDPHWFEEVFVQMVDVL